MVIEHNPPNLHSTSPTQSNLSSIHDNPFKLPKCRYALTLKYNLNPIQLLNKTNKCHTFSGVITRENLDRIRDKPGGDKVICPMDQRSAIRTHQLQIENLVYDEPPESNLTWLTDIYPVYFMIAKSGSTSILDYLRIYNKEYGYDKYGHIGHKIAIRDRVQNINSPCSFTFVRDPVIRFISGYYTINGLLWLALKEKFSNIYNETFLRFELDYRTRKRQKFVRFAGIKGEPMRLKAFLSELKSDSYAFTRLWQIDHIQTQSEILSIYFGKLKSKMHFIGKQERIKEHWSELVGICEYFKNDTSVVFDGEELKKSHVVGWGWKAPWTWEKEYDRFKDFIEYLGLEGVYDWYLKERKNVGNVVDMSEILPPVWYYIDETLYNEIVEYYWQDYECFGYVPSYQQFVKKREQYNNIYGF